MLLWHATALLRIASSKAFIFARLHRHNEAQREVSSSHKKTKLLSTWFNKPLHLSSLIGPITRIFSIWIHSFRIEFSITIVWRMGRSVNLTKMRPVVVCPEMSSPAQSLASVTNVPSNSSLACRGGFGRFCCFRSLWLYSGEGSLRQQIMDMARHIRTIKRPARKVKMLDRRKHHHFRSLRHSISSGERTKPLSSSDILGFVWWWLTKWWWFGSW